jgi:hypothetical protein
MSRVMQIRSATLAFLVMLAVAAASIAPAAAQQPVYPSFPPPPAPSGDSAPHPQTPDAQAPNSDPYGDSPAQQAYPDSTPPGKPSPYPQPDASQDSQQQPAYPPGNEPQSAQQPPYYPPPSEPAYPAAVNPLAWVPRGMELLARTAALHTDFTFDKSMLRLASGVWDGPTDPATASALSRLDGISVHSYHYAAPGLYDPRLLESVRRQYSELGWQHLVSAHPRSGEGATDLWISFHHLQATGAVVLFQNATNLNLIAFSGNLSPLDILHLRGHFGIPRFDGDRFVPASPPRAHVAPAAR